MHLSVFVIVGFICLLLRYQFAIVRYLNTIFSYKDQTKVRNIIGDIFANVSKSQVSHNKPNKFSHIYEQRPSLTFDVSTRLFHLHSAQLSAS
jgi:hypothetical protein